MTFLGSLRLALGDDAPLLRRFLVRAGASGVAQGIALASLLPLASALLQQDQQRAWRWLAVLVATALVALVPHYLQAMAAFSVALSALTRMQQRIGDHVVTLPLGWFTGGRASQVSLAATKGVLSVGNTAAHSTGHVVVGWTSALGITVVVLLWEPLLGLVLLGGLPLVWAARTWSLRLSDDADDRTAQLAADVNRHLLEYTRDQAVLRAAGRSQDYRPLDEAVTRHTTSQRRLLWRQVLSQVATGAVLQAVVAAAFAVGSWQLLDGGADPGLVVGVLAVAVRYYQGLAQAVEHTMALRGTELELRRIRSILEATALPEPRTSAPVTRPGAVELDGVSFGYGEQPVLRDVDVRVEPGTMVALVGPSGAGKSTVLALLARFHDADAGAVRVGGTAVGDQRTEDLMAQLAPVFQDVYLFDDTLEANVRVGRPDATEQEVAQAAQEAGVTEVLQRLPDGWATRVGEGGAALSGGERQRVSLARALLRRAPVLLLDEATAALDTENESHVTQSLHALRGRSTVVVVAHRLHTIREADVVVMMSSEGKVIDAGPHEQLHARCPAYQAFWDSRSSAQSWRWPSTAGRTSGPGAAT